MGTNQPRQPRGASDGTGGEFTPKPKPAPVESSELCLDPPVDAADLLSDPFSRWEIAKLATVRMHDRQDQTCRCSASGGTPVGGCGVHDDRHATPEGSFLAALEETSESGDHWARRFGDDYRRDGDVSYSWDPDNGPG